MKIRVLVVDETAFTRDALKRSVRRFLNDVEVYDALNGSRACSVMRTNKVDIVISAWELPEMSGMEVLQWMRANDKTAKIPFIVTADDADRNLVVNAINAGASDFMAKPFSPEDVQKKVTKQLDRIGFTSNIKKSAMPGQDSVGLLTGGAKQAPQPKRSPDAKKKPAAGKGKAAVSKAKSVEGVARIKFERSGFIAKCAIQELSLTSVSCMMERPEDGDVPSLFEPATADIIGTDGTEIGQLRVFVYAMQSSDPRPDAGKIKINLRFDNNEPAQFEKLSRVISRSPRK